MTVQNSAQYDAVIIGAGIGGLVCGCYLAKAGMKVLIAEQHYKPGGYCTSFKRRDFLFDAAAHSFGSYREGGNMRRIFKELDLQERMTIKRYDPSDIILSPHFRIPFYADTNETLLKLQEAFPRESNGIKSFLSFLSKANPFDFVALRNKTFKDVLDHYMNDGMLKALLSIPILGNGGLPPSLISAFTGAKIYTEFLLDGGYYPEGGMQLLADALAQRFREFGGELRVSCLAQKIITKGSEVSGVELEDRELIPAKYVISNCDARQTFLHLLGRSVVSSEVIHTLKRLQTSLSIFVLYVGMDRYFEGLPERGVNVWILPNYDIEKMYRSLKRRDIQSSTGYMIRVSPQTDSLQAFVNAPFKNRRYWLENKNALLEGFIRRIEQVLPGLSHHIVFKDAATPYTMHRYTLNYRGAAYGWASTPAQLFTPELRQATSIKGLYLTGHWTTQTQGIPGVAYIGHETANLILRREKCTA